MELVGTPREAARMRDRTHHGAEGAPTQSQKQSGMAHALEGGDFRTRRAQDCCAAFKQCDWYHDTRC